MPVRGAMAFACGGFRDPPEMLLDITLYSLSSTGPFHIGRDQLLVREILRAWTISDSLAQQLPYFFKN